VIKSVLIPVNTLANKVIGGDRIDLRDGRGIAEHFRRPRVEIVVHGRDRADGIETVRRVRSAGRDAEYFDGDLTNEEVCRALIRVAVERFWRGWTSSSQPAADTGRGIWSTSLSRAGTRSWA